MSRFFDAVKAGVRGAMSEMGPGEFAAAGRRIACTHCGGTRFDRREAQFNTSGATMVGLDWMNRSGVALICETCSLVQWFASAPERISS
ncbi:hypothetical protein [Longimicrobium sp.]|uniref:hypothetical protein n=1 Tax=Longimicrobium sp. TaxID=2029185 RepID=UPI002E323F48|nr:hypothetical protein [Longimicrobium sp.]HEX6040681.1 hypothetical protein [Longimicrobium sp.]